jgi:fatty acid desaturase (delta-4 desaturase)
MLEEDVLVIDGIYYDTKGLAAIHPGGDIFVRLSNQTDATALFNSAHRRRFPHDRYQKYVVDPSKVRKDVVRPMQRDFSLYFEICDAVKPLIPRNGFAPAHYWVKVALILGTAVFCDLYTIFVGTSLFMSLLMALAFGFIGLNIQHDANHGAVSKNAQINRLLGLTQDYIGGTALGWMMSHNVVHHVHTNDPILDVDLKIPTLRLTDTVSWNPVHVAQHMYFLVLEFVFGVFHALSNFVTIWFRGPKSNQKILSDYWLTHQLTTMILPLRILLGCYLQGYENFLTHLVITYSCGGAYLAFFFIISHNFEGVEKHLDSTKGCFVNLQVTTSSNVGGWLLAQLNGGLNYQIEHHLFPRVHHSNYPYIAPVVRRICEKHGIRYTHFPWIHDNLISTIRHMEFMGRQPKSA